MDTYAEKLVAKAGGRIAYADLLLLKEWKDKRQQIKHREHNHCQVCKEKCMDDYLPKLVGRSGVFFEPATYEEVDAEIEIVHPIYGVVGTYPGQEMKLVPQDIPRFAHIHHTYYVWRKLPWDYPNESLMLVCHLCHADIHETQQITVYTDTNFNQSQSLTLCSRCNGTGYLFQHSHIENGVCFRCNGACFDEWMVPMTYVS